MLAIQIIQPWPDVDYICSNIAALDLICLVIYVVPQAKNEIFPHSYTTIN